MHYKRKITWRVKLKRKITLTKKNQKNEDKKKKTMHYKLGLKDEIENQ